MVNGLTFGQRLKQLRETSGMTQVELARRAGISIYHWARLESGRASHKGRAELRPKLPTVVKVIAALKSASYVPWEDVKALFESVHRPDVTPDQVATWESQYYATGVAAQNTGQSYAPQGKGGRLKKVRSALYALEATQLSPNDLELADELLATITGTVKEYLVKVRPRGK